MLALPVPRLEPVVDARQGRGDNFGGSGGFVEESCQGHDHVIVAKPAEHVRGGTAEQFIVTADGQTVSVHGDFVGWGYVASAAGHGALWVAALLVLACVIFQRRDFV